MDAQFRHGLERGLVAYETSGTCSESNVPLLTLEALALVLSDYWVSGGSGAGGCFPSKWRPPSNPPPHSSIQNRPKGKLPRHTQSRTSKYSRARGFTSHTTSRLRLLS